MVIMALRSKAPEYQFSAETGVIDSLCFPCLLEEANTGPSDDEEEDEDSEGARSRDCFLLEPW